MKFDLLICDEGHRLKNTSTQTWKLLTSCVETKRRIVLTGTPLQNDLQELFSIAEFCNPGRLGTAITFRLAANLTIGGAPVMVMVMVSRWMDAGTIAATLLMTEGRGNQNIALMNGNVVMHENEFSCFGWKWQMLLPIRNDAVKSDYDKYDVNLTI